MPTNEAASVSVKAPNPKLSLLKRMTDLVGVENLSLIIALIIMVALITTQTEYFFHPVTCSTLVRTWRLSGLLQSG